VFGSDRDGGVVRQDPNLIRALIGTPAALALSRGGRAAGDLLDVQAGSEGVHLP
jgi:hypothetical protein